MSAPGRLVAPGAARRSRSVHPHCPAPASGPRNDDPRRIAHDKALLDHVIQSAWQGLGAHRTIVCPVCGGAMAPRYGSAREPIGGRCTRCGSTLS